MRYRVKYLWGYLLIIGLIGCHYRELPKSTDISNMTEVDPGDIDQDEYTDLDAAAIEDYSIEQEQEYEKASWMTRDTLAYIFNQHFKHVFPLGRKPPVIIDLDQATYQEALLASAAAGLIPVGRDHRIRPGSRIRKQDLSKAIWRVLELADTLPDQSVFDASLLPYDITTSHNAWREIAGCLFTGIMKLEPDNLFHPGQIMNGKEILESIDSLKRYLKRYRK